MSEYEIKYEAAGRIRSKLARVMRGQVVVREFDAPSASIWMPPANQREIVTHRGVVLALGAPARAEFYREGRVVLVEQPHGFELGDTVIYHFSSHNRDAYTFEWEDGKPATWIPQYDVDAVLEGSPRDVN